MWNTASILSNNNHVFFVVDYVKIIELHIAHTWRDT